MQSSTKHLDANMARWIGREPVDTNIIEWSGRPANNGKFGLAYFEN